MPPKKKKPPARSRAPRRAKPAVTAPPAPAPARLLGDLLPLRHDPGPELASVTARAALLIWRELEALQRVTAEAEAQLMELRGQLTEAERAELDDRVQALSEGPVPA